MEKRCSRCKETKPLDGFYPRNDRGRYESRCKVCCLERHRLYVLANKAKFGRIRKPVNKRCWRCHETKPSSEFGRGKGSADGLNPSCKACARDYSQRIGNPRARLLDPNGRKGHLWTRYRLRPDEYAVLLASQNGVCGLCAGVLPKTPHVDHCHQTGRVRGLLCNACNSGLGFIERDGFIEQAMKYLQGGGQP